ncbi:MAG: DUF4381 family protein [Gammaproteobacteria bacterium]|nr:DUF4381 family protein [Gammaproteobacteria bacterium]
MENCPSRWGFSVPLGGWLLAALLLVSVCTFALVHKRRRNSPTYAALHELSQIEASLNQDIPPAHATAAISQLIRRFVIRTRGPKWAGVHDRRWLEILDAQLGHSETPLFTSAGGTCLLWAPYAHPEQVDEANARALINISRRWLKAPKRASLKMHFFRDCGVRSVLQSSCITYTLRFCARRPRDQRGLGRTWV